MEAAKGPDLPAADMEAYGEGWILWDCNCRFLGFGVSCEDGQAAWATVCSAPEAKRSEELEALV